MTVTIPTTTPSTTISPSTETETETETETSLLHRGADLDDEAALLWWRSAVIYQVYPRSWADSDGDGIGDLPGTIERLPYLRELGVDALWLSPFYVSPMNDAGYDVADYEDIDPLFGTLADADRLIATSHDLGLKVIIDLVPNHSSSEHPWFQAALAAGPGSPERARYIFREGLGPDGAQPPSDWLSVFGGPGWSRVSEPVDDGSGGRPGQWYLHLFDVTQPDFNWHNTEVIEAFHRHIRFWLERGVDGFRVDVAHSLFKDMSFPSWPYGGEMLVPDELHDSVGPMWDRDEVHEIYRGWRALLEEYSVPGDPSSDRILCAEAWVSPPERLARYVRSDEMHQAFNFAFLEAGWDPARLPIVVAESYQRNDAVDAPTTWVLSNHDVVRHASRFGLQDPTRRPNGIGPEDPQPDAALGVGRARAATTLMLGLPGSAYLYQGEELGLPDATDLPGEVRQDPTYLHTGHAQLGRDGCRIPMPWTKEGPSLGFGPTARTWLPQPAAYAELAVDQQDGVDGSTLELYRILLRLRRERLLGAGSIEQVRTPEGLLAYIVTSPAGLRTGIALNAGTRTAGLPFTGELLVHSRPDGDLGSGLSAESAAWLALD